MTDAAYVMVAQKQERLDKAALERWADGFGLSLRLIYEWSDLVDEAIYWSPVPASVAARKAAERVRDRLVAVEAHPDSIGEWLDAISALKV